MPKPSSAAFKAVDRAAWTAAFIGAVGPIDSSEDIPARCCRPPAG